MTVGDHRMCTLGQVVLAENDDHAIFLSAEERYEIVVPGSEFRTLAVALNLTDDAEDDGLLHLELDQAQWLALARVALNAVGALTSGGA